MRWSPDNDQVRISRALRRDLVDVSRRDLAENREAFGDRFADDLRVSEHRFVHHDDLHQTHPLIDHPDPRASERSVRVAIGPGLRGLSSDGSAGTDPNRVRSFVATYGVSFA